MKAVERTKDAPLLLNVKEVARLLSIGERTVWAKAAAGVMPAPIRLGRSRRWRREELEEWIRSGCPDLNKER